MWREVYAFLCQVAAWGLVLGAVLLLAALMGRMGGEWREMRPPAHDPRRCERCSRVDR